MQILVCGVAGCQSSDSLEIIKELEKQIRTGGLEKEVKVVKTGCFGLCAQGPIMITYPDQITYVRVKPEDVREIAESHIKGGQPVERLLADDGNGKKIMSRELPQCLKITLWNSSERSSHSSCLPDSSAAAASCWTWQRLLKVARTIADIEGDPHIERRHLQEALSYRAIDRLLLHLQKMLA